MLKEAVFKQITDIFGGRLVVKDSDLEDYSHDEYPLPDMRSKPDCVVLPENAQQISRLLKLANKEGFAVIPRGGGTGLCGGCVALGSGKRGSVVLSLEKMNKVLELDYKNYFAVAQAGVRLMDFYKEVEEKGFFFPPHPGDETAMLGGVIATNAGGSRTVKYGVVRNFIKGLEVVLPNGEIIQLGGKILKNSTGYSLMHLMIGSEGTLGVITKAYIHLLPPPGAEITLIAQFDRLEEAIQTVPDILGAKIVPMAVEFLERDVVNAAENFLGKSWPCKGGNAYLMVILDGSTEDEVLSRAEAIGEICLKNKSSDVFIASQKNKQKEILEFRSQLYETMKRYMIDVLDIVVPPSEIPAHIKEVHSISARYRIWLPTFGHASDGNVHTHIMKAKFVSGRWEEMPNDEWQSKYPLVKKELHNDAKNRGGMISGEHGIGFIKKQYLSMSVGAAQLEVFRSIKKALDPSNILNPGKII
mgnify:CR=1 FL=1